MITLEVTLTNEQVMALEPFLANELGRLRQRLQRRGDPRPTDKSAIAYVAFRLIANPLLQHLAMLRGLPSPALDDHEDGDEDEETTSG